MTVDRPAVLVPGMLCDGALWDGIRERLDVRTVDVALSAPSISGMADEVLASVDGPFILAGLSLGGIVGFEVLRRAPDRIAGLCVMSTNAGAPRPEQREAWHSMAAETERGEFDAVVADILPTMFATTDPPEEQARGFRAMARRTGPDRFRAQLSAQATRTDAHPHLRGARCPSLVISGTADALCPPEFHRAIARELTGGTLASLPGAGHLLPVEQPDQLSRLMNTWIDQQVHPARRSR